MFSKEKQKEVGSTIPAHEKYVREDIVSGLVFFWAQLMPHQQFIEVMVFLPLH